MINYYLTFFFRRSHDEMTSFTLRRGWSRRAAFIFAGVVIRT